MNVNPFSYLIEKLKGKVDKSGDTMTGNLNLEKANGEISVKCQNTTKLTSAYIYSANSGEHGIWSNGYHDGSFHNSGLWLVNRGTDGSVKVNGTSVPSNGGTVALTSDFSDVKIYRHQISQQLSSGRTEIPIPSALTGKTIVGMTIKFGENIIPTAPVDDNGTYDQSYAIRSIVYGSNVIITTTSNWGTKTMNILFFYV